MNFLFQPAMTTDDTDFTDEQWKTGSYPCYPYHCKQKSLISGKFSCGDFGQLIDIGLSGGE